MFHCILRCYARQPRRMHVGVHTNCTLFLLDFKLNCYESRDCSKYQKNSNSEKCAQQKSSSYMKMDGQKCIKDTKKHILHSFPELLQSCLKMNVYCCWLLVQRDRVTVMFSVLLYIILSVQIVYSVQLNCTDCN